jgi:starvation-inducible DNA-binding protein
VTVTPMRFGRGTGASDSGRLPGVLLVSDRFGVVGKGRVVVVTQGDMAMESVANSVQLPPLDNPNERVAVGEELQRVLQDLIDLSLIGKQLHWSVVGAAARGVHLFLDELVGEWRELADVVAERAVTLGFVPDGQGSAVVAGSRVEAVVVRSLADHVVVWELGRRVAAVAERVRARLGSIGAADLVSQEVLIRVVGMLEKQQWLLRVQLGEKA